MKRVKNFHTVSSICVFTPGVGSSELGVSQSTEQGHVELRSDSLRNYVNQFAYIKAHFLRPKLKWYYCLNQVVCGSSKLIT